MDRHAAEHVPPFGTWARPSEMDPVGFDLAQIVLVQQDLAGGGRFSAEIVRRIVVFPAPLRR
jgi:hypothetical protein